MAAVPIRHIPRERDTMSHLYLAHHGIKGMKWGIRRFRNEDGTLTDAGKKRYSKQLVRTVTGSNSWAEAKERARSVVGDARSERTKELRSEVKRLAKVKAAKKAYPEVAKAERQFNKAVTEYLDSLNVDVDALISEHENLPLTRVMFLPDASPSNATTRNLVYQILEDYD